MTYIQTLCRWW